MFNDNSPFSAGWLVEVRSRRVKDAHALFAAAISDRLEAHAAVTNIVGELHFSVQRMCGLTARALARLGVQHLEVKQLVLESSSDAVCRAPAPAQHGVAGQLGAVVGDDHRRHGYKSVENTYDAATGERRVDLDAKPCRVNRSSMLVTRNLRRPSNVSGTKPST